MATLSIRIEEKTAARLAAIAQAEQQSIEALVESLIEDFTDTDDARLAEYEQTGHGIDHPTALAWLRDLAAGEYHPCPKRRRLGCGIPQPNITLPDPRWALGCLR